MTEKSENKLWILCVAIFFVIVVWLGSYWYIENNYNEYPIKGQVGDMFGAINSLFSGLAFACLIYTIYLQRTELDLQRKELVETRGELKKTAEAQMVSTNIQGLNTLISAYSNILNPSGGMRSYFTGGGDSDKHEELFKRYEKALTDLEKMMESKTDKKI